MEPIEITVSGTNIAVTKTVPLTAGLVGQPVTFRFDSVWEGLRKTAVFRAGEKIRHIEDIKDTVTIPPEALKDPQLSLFIGVYGSADAGLLTIPTLWALAGTIQPGAHPYGDEGTDVAAAKQALELFFSETKAEQTAFLKRVEAEQTAFAQNVEADQTAFLKTAGEALTAVQEIANANTPAIVCEASGDVLAVSDSSERPVQGLKVYGKTTQATTAGRNLFSHRHTAVVKGLTFEISGSVIKASGIPTDTYGTIWEPQYLPFGMKVGSKYRISSSASYQINMWIYNSSGAVVATLMDGGEAVTVPDTAVKAAVYFAKTTVGTAINETVYVMLSEGETAYPYEPYTGGVPSPNPDYPQELVSVGDCGSVGVTVAGKNLLDISRLEKGAFSQETGEKTDGVSLQERTAYYVIVKAGQSLIHSNSRMYNARAFWFDSNGVYIGTDALVYNTPVTVPDGAGRVYFVSGTEGFTMDGLNPQIEFGSTPTAYEPYKPAQTLTFSTPNSLPGIPVTSGGNYTDENGQQYIANYRDWARGVDVQRVVTQILTPETQCYVYTGQENSYVYVSDYLTTAERTGLCSHYQAITWNALVAGKTGVYFNNNAKQIIFANTAQSTLDEFKALVAEQYAAGTPFVVMYPLAEPIETPIPEEELAAYHALHTNQLCTTLYNDAGAHMELRYVADTKCYIDNKFAELTAAIVNNT